MKALILAGGRGNRLDELSEQHNKCLIKINGIHVIEYSLASAANTDVDEIIIVVGYRAEDIINLYGNAYKGKTIKYVIQHEQRGLVHAIECAQKAIDGDDFILMLADEVLQNPLHQNMINEFHRSGIFALCGILAVDDKTQIKKTYTVIKDGEDQIYRLIEKPRNPLNHFQGTGDCVFINGIYDYVQYTPLHHVRKEKELPDLIQCAIDDGMMVKAFVICDKYVNINTHDDIKLAESFFK